MRRDAEARTENVLDAFSLEGKRGFVTGGGGAIGSAIAIAMAQAGAHVAVLDVDLAAAESVVTQVRQLGARSLAVRCDVTDSHAVDAAIDLVAAEFGGLDIAVNNAGIVINAPASTMSPEQWDRVVAVNLRGVFLCAQKAGRIMLESGSGGSILNTASMSASVVNHPQPQASYNASKAGVVQLTRSLASEWAPMRIRVNSLSPGYTRTPLTDSASLRELRELWIGITPMERMAEVEDLTGPAVFLLSDAARFVTGHDLIVDGGYTVR
jgi:NAD(P)-dependent dehydrogenase (short-subunit alcohol dehydrogenase family)